MDKKDLAQLKRDAKRARARVGDTAKWLLDFAYRDLSKLDQNGVVDTGFEILAFAVAEWTPPKEDSLEPLPTLFQILGSDGLFTKQNGLGDRFQREIRSRFDDSKLGRWWEYKAPAPVERFTVFRIVSLDENGHSAVSGSHASQRNESTLDILLGTATKVVKRESERFAICQNPRCQSLAFVAERRRRAKYCTAKCSSYVRVNKKRGKL
jgi:hypothetical protein